jgi:hypothetical protein
VHNSGRIYIFNFGISAGISDFGISDLAGITDYSFRILANPKYFSFGAILTKQTRKQLIIKDKSATLAPANSTKLRPMVQYYCKKCNGDLVKTRTRNMHEAEER